MPFDHLLQTQYKLKLVQEENLRLVEQIKTLQAIHQHLIESDQSHQVAKLLADFERRSK